MSSKQPKILFACGGTGGHVFPALAIAEELQRLRPSAEIHFVGTDKKIEARVVPERGYPFSTIWISGLRRKLTLENILFPLKILVSLIQSFFVLKKIQPSVVVGTGGYVCGPVLSVAARMRIPTVVHESNSYPGITTRILAHKATTVFTAFEATNRWFKRTDNVELVGTPVRQSLVSTDRSGAMKYFGLRPEKKTLLVFGGSLGATSINNAVRGMLDGLKQAGVQIIWQTGEQDYQGVQDLTKSMNGWIGPFIERMDYAYTAADLVLCRAGATTVAEITALGKAAILVPYPYATADHQTHNALALAEAGAAIVIPDRDLPMKIQDAVLVLLGDDDKRRKMSEASKSLGKPQAGEMIAKKILELAN